MAVKVNIKKLDNNAVLPTYGSEFSAGADLYALLNSETVTVKAGETMFFNTGLAIEVPVGYAGLVYARSGLACKSGLAPANKVGVIDSDYRGEITVALHNHSANDITVKNHERIAQLVITPFLKAEFCECDELESTERGVGGFGSTGKF